MLLPAGPRVLILMGKKALRGFGDLENLHGDFAAGCFCLDDFADFGADESPSDGRFFGNAVFQGIGLVGTDKRIFDFFFIRFVVHLDGGADACGIGLYFMLVNDLDVFEHGLNVGDTLFDGSLFVFGFVVFTVFGKVTESAGSFDGLGNFLAFGGFQVFKFFLELFQAVA